MLSEPELLVRLADELDLPPELRNLRDLLPEPANFGRGVAAYGEGDFDAAFAQFAALAEDGDPTAQYNLGVMYARGHGVTRDVNEATNWFRRTVEQAADLTGYDLTLIETNAPAIQSGAAGEFGFFQRLLGGNKTSEEYKAGLRAFEVRDYDTAFALWEQQAQAGDPAAQGMLGYMYELGLGVTRDAEAASALYRQAAATGDPNAQFNLGLMLAAGGQDAASWFRGAASQGHGLAQNNIGVRYAIGGGVPVDMREATRWLRRAAEQGVAEAEFNLGVMLATGRAGGVNLANAAALFERAAEKGVASAQYNLGIMLLHGDGVEADPEQGVAWLRRAAEQGGTPNGLPMRISALASSSVTR